MSLNNRDGQVIVDSEEGTALELFEKAEGELEGVDRPGASLKGLEAESAALGRADLCGADISD